MCNKGDSDMIERVEPRNINFFLSISCLDSKKHLEASSLTALADQSNRRDAIQM